MNFFQYHTKIVRSLPLRVNLGGQQSGRVAIQIEVKP